ncbi:MAG: hypothetical protein ACK41T_11410 [Pseudobdellovibrio sp.]
MSKGLNKSKYKNKDHSDESTTHFRRCHICGVCNEKQEELVSYCEGCGKALAPFVFFDEKELSGISIDRCPSELTSEMYEYLKMTRASTQTIYPPIWGLAVYW